MKEIATKNREKRLSRQDRVILESAQVLLRPDRPDHFDYNTLATLCGVERHLVQEAFPYPELLAVGVVAMAWESDQQALAQVDLQTGHWWARALELCRCHGRSCLNRPNGFRLIAREWEPDPGLLECYATHPAVCSYQKRSTPLLPMLRTIWPRFGGMCTPDFLVAALHDRLHTMITIDTRRDGSRPAWLQELLAEFLSNISQILAKPPTRTMVMNPGVRERFPNA